METGYTNEDILHRQPIKLINTIRKKALHLKLMISHSIFLPTIHISPIIKTVNVGKRVQLTLITKV